MCFPSFLLDSKSFTQDSTGPSSYNDTCSGSLADTILILQASTTINSQSNHLTSHIKSTAKCTKEGSSISDKQKLNKVSGMESFKESLISSGLSESATSLIFSARMPNSKSNYDSSWGK